MVLVQVDVRNVHPQEIAQLTRLCMSARDESSLGTQVCAPEVDKLARHLGTYAQMPDSNILVAVQEDVVVGFALTRTIAPGLFIDTTAVYLEAIFVADSARRRGVGHQLLLAVGQRAQEVGASEIYALPLPGSRGVQRFLARLGFAPAAAHRVVSVSSLMRNINSELNRSRRGAPRMLDELIARRRRARVETNSGPLDLRAFQAAYAAERSESTSQPAQASESDRDYHAS